VPPGDARLDELLGAGAGLFRASMDLLPDPVGVWWAVRDGRGGVVDFETGYSNPAMQHQPLLRVVAHRPGQLNSRRTSCDRVMRSTSMSSVLGHCCILGSWVGSAYMEGQP
jgi:hypothetical protein